MSIGTYLVGTAVIILIAAYVGSPFRRTKVDVDSVIEKWVSDASHRIKVQRPLFDEEITDEVIITGAVEHDVADAEPVNFCPQCGRRVEEDHRFCPGCGTQLVKGAAK